MPLCHLWIILGCNNGKYCTLITVHFEHLRWPFSPMGAPPTISPIPTIPSSYRNHTRRNAETRPPRPPLAPFLPSLSKASIPCHHHSNHQHTHPPNLSIHVNTPHPDRWTSLHVSKYPICISAPQRRPLAPQSRCLGRYKTAQLTSPHPDR
ncbi:hypothetical protein P154DRAFT_257775 [Amniculicola lignicola CBS 123094]|uniref:Uncharacterized protein n=1 Tax=Amniculicola lignicola CBS 123094 TaxID=1392246 RepID=A0A6A5WZD5_9PLEO|nr:hypothetical protein P154DRAFT_257775 [Amniculicola lignicola CBS 123094]